MGDYQQWKDSGGRDAAASGWAGTVLGYLCLSFIFTYPVYVLIAAVSDSITAVPDSLTEVGLWVVLAVLGFIGGPLQGMRSRRIHPS